MMIMIIPTIIKSDFQLGHLMSLVIGGMFVIGNTLDLKFTETLPNSLIFIFSSGILRISKMTYIEVFPL